MKRFECKLIPFPKEVIIEDVTPNVDIYKEVTFKLDPKEKRKDIVFKEIGSFIRSMDVTPNRVIIELN